VYPKSDAIVSVDTETTGLYTDDPCQRKNCGCGRGSHVTVVSLAGPGWSVGIPFDMRDTLNEWGEGPITNSTEADWDELLLWLSTKKLVMHKAKFDLHMLLSGGPNGWRGRDLRDNIIDDTKVAAWYRWPLESTSLKPIAERLWGKYEIEEQAAMKKWLVEHKHKDFEMWYAPPRLLLPYAAQDTALTFRLAEKLRGEFNPEDLQMVEREYEVMKVLTAMEARGIGFSVSNAEKIHQYLLEYSEGLAKTLPFKATRQAALKYWVQTGNQRVVDMLPRTEAGAPSLDDKARNMIRNLNLVLPHSPNFFYYLDAQLALSRYYGDKDVIQTDGKRKTSWKKMTGKDGRLRADFYQDGARTMRFSCHRVNLQAIPREKTVEKRYPNPKSCFEARPGYHLVELDMSQAEMRVATVIADCKSMRRIIESGRDIHDETTREIFYPGTHDNDFEFKSDGTVLRYKAEDNWSKWRHIGKTLNFAVLYGAGADAVVELLSDKIAINREEAQSFISKHNAAFPEFKQTSREAQHTVETRGYLILVSGRRRYFGLKDNTHKAFNAVIQGNVAEAVKDWMIYLERVYPGKLLLQIHDSIVMELPVDARIEDDIKRQAETMLTEMFGIPMIVGVKYWNEKKLEVAA